VAFGQAIPIGNQTPQPEDDTYGVPSNQTLNVNEPGVLANDEDGDGDELTAVLDQDAPNGTLVLNEDGSFSYTPNEGYTGDDTFTYFANDGTENSAAATVTIRVREAADTPLAIVEAVPTEGFLPLTVNFDGSKSFDPRGVDIAAYRWHFGRGRPQVTLVPTTSITYNVAGTYTASLTVVNANGEISAPKFLPIRVGDGVVGDGALFLTKGSFKINWKKHDTGAPADTFKISGHLNPNDFPDGISALQMAVRVNGNPISSPQTPRSARATAEPAYTAKLKSSNGSFSFKASKIDLRGLLGLRNETEARTYRMKIEVELIGQTFNVNVYKGLFDFEYTSTEGKTAAGTFKYRSQSAYAGFFKSTSTRATEQSGGGFSLSATGKILADLSYPVVPNGDITVAFGGTGGVASAASFTVFLESLDPKGANETSSYTYSKGLRDVPELKKFQINNAKRSFTIKTNELAGTGIPTTGQAEVVHDLRAWLIVPTADATLVFRTMVEIKRGNSTSKQWKR
jgi:VCBS repeat-containing protein